MPQGVVRGDRPGLARRIDSGAMMLIMRTLGAMFFIAAIHSQAEALMPAVGCSQSDTTRYFPKVEGSNLEGRHFSLPTDFEGELNVVLVAFKRGQQDDVDTWLPYLTALATERSTVRVYEVPTLNRSYSLVRPFIDGGMARGIPEKATREATITLYINKNPFKRALGIASEGAIRVLLVAQGGRVLWHADGHYTVDAADDLAAEIARQMTTGAP